MFRILSRLKQKLIRSGMVKPGKRQSFIKYIDKNSRSFHADHININHFAGWVAGEQEGGVHTPANVQIFRSDNLVGEARASLPRVDVSSSGKGPLNCGFQFRLYWRHFEVGHNKAILLVDGKKIANILIYVSVKDLMVAQTDEIVTQMAKK